MAIGINMIYSYEYSMIWSHDGGRGRGPTSTTSTLSHSGLLFVSSQTHTHPVIRQSPFSKSFDACNHSSRKSSSHLKGAGPFDHVAHFHRMQP